MTTRADPSPVVSELTVSQTSRQGLQSAMAQLEFRQSPRTTGVSPDTLRFRFDAPVDVQGVLISADIGPGGLALVEFAVG